MDSDFLTEQLADASFEIVKQVNLYVMMKYNRIVWDFMTMVIGEKYRTQDFSFSKKDLNPFFQRLQKRLEYI